MYKYTVFCVNRNGICACCSQSELSRHLSEILGSVAGQPVGRTLLTILVMRLAILVILNNLRVVILVGKEYCLCDSQKGVHNSV